MTCPHTDHAGEALRLVRLALNTGSAGGGRVHECLLPAVASYLAYLSAGLLSDLAYASGDDAGRLLDIIETETLAKAARS